MPSVTKFANANTVVATGWTNPTNGYADDASYTTAAPGKNASITTDYGFPAFSSGDIPDGATIDSVTAEIQYKSSTTGSTNAVIGLQLDNGGLLGTETTFGMNTSDQTVTKQATTGIALADLRNADQVQVRVRGARSSSNTAITWSVDYVKLTVVYVLAYTLTASGGSYTETGTAATLTVGRKLTADGGVFTETGTAGTLSRGRSLVCASGAFAETGSAAGLLVGRKVAADAGSFTESGTAASLAVGRLLAADAGDFALTSQDADLTHTTTVAASYTLAADGGSFDWTRTDAGLGFGRRLGAASGAVAWTGTATGLRVDRVLAAASGGYGLTGCAATLTGPDGEGGYSGLCANRRARRGWRRP